MFVPELGRGGLGWGQVYPLMGLYIRIYMYEQDGVGWAETRGDDEDSGKN